MTTKVDRIQIDYTLTFDTPFHFGTGIRFGLIDRTVVRDREEYLYVPGSTFKGVLRERCEQLARFYEQDAQMRQLITSPHNAEAALRGLGQTVTMVTRVFGSQNHPGRLFFDDARQTDEAKLQYHGQGNYKGLQTDLYTQVRLDRSTRTAVRNALYTSEFGVRYLTFQGSITGWLECMEIEHSRLINTNIPEDSPTYSLLLLLAGLHMIERLGGNKSTGKGQCNCEITRLVLNKRECSKGLWHSWLEQLDTLAYYYLS